MAFYSEPYARLITGDCLEVLAGMEPESVQACITSPPYWGLRRYEGNQERIWGGREGCGHVWGREVEKQGPKKWNTATGEVYPNQSTTLTISQGRFCQLCSAWRGSYGLEPTVEMYVEHTIEVLRAIRRVLRSDGVVWWNIGDSYASGKGTCFNPGGGADSLEGHERLKEQGAYPLDRGNKSTLEESGLKPLDLCGIPQRVFLAAQADGWWVRSMIVLSKRNPMPESVGGWFWSKHRVKVGSKRKATQGYSLEVGMRDHSGDFRLSRNQDTQWQDCPGCEKCSPNGGYVLRKGSWRPTESHEYLIMLTKTAEYWADGEEVREPHQSWQGEQNSGGFAKKAILKSVTHNEFYAPSLVNSQANPAGRNLRSVWEITTEPFGLEMCRACKRIYDSAKFKRLPDKPGSRKCHCAEGNDDYMPSWTEMPIEVSGVQSPLIIPVEVYTGQARADYAQGKAQNPSDTKRRILEGQARRQRQEQQAIEPMDMTMTEMGWRCELCGQVYSIEEWLGLPEARVKVCRCGESDWLSHFATFAKSLPMKCILASTPPKVCAGCGAPWARVMEIKQVEQVGVTSKQQGYRDQGLASKHSTIGRTHAWKPGERDVQTLGWLPTCACGPDAGTRPAVVLDPFSGSGTTLVAAKELGRGFVGIEISPLYNLLAQYRLEHTGVGML